MSPSKYRWFQYAVWSVCIGLLVLIFISTLLSLPFFGWGAYCVWMGSNVE